MDETRYQELCHHLEAVLNSDEANREDYLQSLSARDAALAVEVRQLVASYRRAEADEFLLIDDELPATQIFLPDDDANQLEDAPAIHLPEFIGKYKVLAELGKGGMGTVYRAFHEKSGREVALKVVHAGRLTNPEQKQRFEKEAESAAALQHENIVPVFDVGEHDGIPFFTMPVIDGRDLQKHLVDSPMTQHQIAHLVKTLALAVQYAHDGGIVHRDLKPGNVMIDANGKPWLADFGIAKRMDDDERLTRTGQVIGTVRYMSPELVAHANKAGPASDAYGLGAILYHCLTGGAPFKGTDVLQTCTDVRTRLPRSPREVNAGIDSDLDTICMRCLQKEPTDRYGGAEELATDLDRFLKNEPIVGGQSSWWRNFLKVIARGSLPADLRSAGAARWGLIVNIPMHLAVFAIIVGGWGVVPLWAALLVGTVGHGLVNYRFHWSHYWQLEMIERQSGLIQLSVSLAFVALFLIHGPLTTSTPVDDFLNVYPPLMIVIGVATFAHAGIHSGRWLLSGTICFPAAVLMVSFREFSPLILAAISTVILVQADSQLRRNISPESGK